MTGAIRDDLVLMGFVGKPHGVRGSIRIVPETDDPNRFLDLDRLFIEVGRKVEEREVVGVKMHTTSKGLTPVVDLDGVSDRPAADALRGYRVFAHEDDLPLGDDEYFLDDLIGLEVRDEEGGTVGEVTDVMPLPAGPVMVVHREGSPDAMIPAIPEFVVQVEDDYVVVRLIEGLLD